jgi:hypothetical protein
MDESPTGCWTNHHSIIQFKNQWYLFYHHNDYSPKFDKARSIRVDSLFFNNDGSIQKVIPTLRGVGLTDAGKQIQMDRYSMLSDQGASIAFIDTTNRFEGWKTILNGTGAWVQYNNVEFGKKNFKRVVVRAGSEKGGIIEIHLNNPEGPVIAHMNITAGTEWQIVKAPISGIKQGVKNIVLLSIGNNPVEVDWIRFE